MRYSDFQLAVRNLRGSDLTESGLDEISITDLAQKESELIEHLILNQPESRAVKVRLLHEIDECLKDFYFFVSHAKRELVRARKIGDEGTTRRQRHAWQRVRDIISGVEGGLMTYFQMLEKYFPEELERYDSGTIIDFLPYYSEHRQVLTGIPAKAYEITKFESKLEQFEYWEENISVHVQERAEAAEYWGVPESLLVGSLTRGFSQLGFAPKQIYEQFVQSWMLDSKVIKKVSYRLIKTYGLPIPVDPFEVELNNYLELGTGSIERLIKSELAKCDKWDIDLPKGKNDLSNGSDYYFRTLYHVFYREYLLARWEELNNPETKEISLITTKPKAEVHLPTAKAAPATGVMTLQQIALAYHYQDKHIGNLEQANTIAQEFKHKSGEKLLKHYNNLSSVSARTGAGTSQQNSSREKNFKAVIAYLTTLNIQAARRAEEEYLIFKNKREEYS